MTHTDAHRKARRRYYAMTCASSGLRHAAERVSIPDDVEVRLDPSPCFLCGARDPCRHKP